MKSIGTTILYHTENLLRSVSSNVPPNENVLPLISALKHAIRYEDKVWTGCGLSICGIQIGVPLRLMIISRPLFWRSGRHHQGFDILINPEIIKKSSEMTEEWEGCLSIPDTECLVKRHQAIEIKYMDLLGKYKKKQAEKTLARVIQHEIDHFDGILMTDKAGASRPKKDHTQQIESSFSTKP